MHRLADSVSEKIYVTIGGVKQGMFIRGKNTPNSVLLGQSAHSSLFEEPERFVQILIEEVQNGDTALADTKV